MTNHGTDTDSIDQYSILSFVLYTLYPDGIDPSVNNFRSLTNSIDHWFKKFYLPDRSTGLRFFLLMTIGQVVFFAIHRLLVSIQSMFVWPSVPTFAGKQQDSFGGGITTVDLIPFVLDLAY